MCHSLGQILVVHIPFVCMVKIKFLEHLQVDHFATQSFLILL